VLLVLLLGSTFLFRENLFPAWFAPAVTPTALSSAVPSKAVSKASPTKPVPTVTSTPRPTRTPVILTPQNAVIRPDNAQRVIQQKPFNKMSIIDMDWIENTNGLVDAGSQKVSFIDTASETIKEAALPGEIPLAMAVAPLTAKVYLLFNDKIQVLDVNTLKVTDTFGPIAGGARSIAVSPDGKLLALGISDNKTQLLNAAQGNVVRNLKSNYGGWAVEFSPDSKYIVSGTSQGVLKWEADTGLWRPISTGQDEIIKSLAFSHDGTKIAGGGNGVIYLWNMEDGQQLQKITGDFGGVNGIDFSPDDSLFVSGTDDGSVRIWNTATGVSVKELTGSTGEIADVCFSPDGQYIASGAVKDATIRIWGLP